MPKIDRILAYVVADKNEDDEGIPALHGAHGMVVPMIGADEVRMLSLMPEAQEVANRLGKPVKILRFTQFEVVGTVEPQEG